MKTLTQKQKDAIKKEYQPRWAEAMLQPDVMDKCIRFLERYPSFQLTYTKVFFSVNGFSIYEKDGEQRLFCNPTKVFKDLTPATVKDAEGNWRKWLLQAKLVKTII